jgi:2-methylisocitrate lyase-like PEP mutase family enzyme
MNATTRRRVFRRLHAAGCFVMPNPWDIGSARYLAHLGFPALATTSAGFAFSQGLPDTEEALSRDRNLAHIAEIAAASEVPVNADFASGYGATAAAVGDSVARCIATGAAGLSIEDASGDPGSPLFDLALAVERVRAARQAIEASGCDVVLTARAECYLTGHRDPFHESVRRLQAYAAAGADVLFAPGLQDRAEIAALVDAVRPKPVSLMMGRDAGLRVDDIAALGVRRISLGPALALVAWHGFREAARELRAGSFAGLAAAAPYPELNRFFADDHRGRAGGAV